MYQAHPATTLWNKAKDYIPLKRTADKLLGDRTYDSFNAYSHYDIINDALDNAIDSGKINDKPSPIIAIQYMDDGYPIYYYIKKDLVSQDRKKKKNKPKSQRKIIKKCRCK